MSSFFDQDTDEKPVTKKRHIEGGQLQQVNCLSKWSGDLDADDDDGRPVLSPAGGGRVGLRLLQSMHFVTPAVEEKMRVVEGYVPLSVGGFMNTTTEVTAGAISSTSHMRPGDIMCLRTPTPMAAGQSSDTGSAGLQFVRETDLSAEEQQYGRRLTCDMVQMLFEVNRVDNATNSLEALFLDGTRRKLNMYAVRPAGFVEVELFRRWKADPSSRPVRTIYASREMSVPSFSLSVEAGGGASIIMKNYSNEKADNVDITLDSSNNNSNDQDGNTLGPTTRPTPWWITPQLVVRVVEESAGELFGKKFVVRSVSRGEKRIRLAPLQSNDTVFDGGLEDSLVDIVGCEALETIVPKVGAQGILVQGSMRGELVTVLARHRNAKGELTAVKVSSTRTNEEFTVEPHELCQLALQKPRSKLK